MEILYRNLLSIDVELSSSCLWKSPKYAHKNSSMILVICPRPIRCFASLKSALVDPKPSASKKWPVLAPKDRGFLEMGVPQNGSFIMENPFINGSPGTNLKGDCWSLLKAHILVPASIIFPVSKLKITVCLLILRQFPIHYFVRSAIKHVV